MRLYRGTSTAIAAIVREPDQALSQMGDRMAMDRSGEMDHELEADSRRVLPGAY